MIDSFDIMSNLKEITEYIYELLINQDIIKKQIKIIFIFNKIEISLFKKEQMIKQIQNENDKKTKKIKTIDIDEKELYISKGDNFNFEKYCPIPFKLIEISILKQNLKELNEEIIKF